jgi:dTMP kinase
MAKKKIKGIFISFEGTEGSGKSTLIRSLAAQLQERGLSIIQTREPGGNALAEQIRSILLHQEMDPQTELFLYEAARSHHFKSVIEPALNQGKIILCDRFTDSTLAYQGMARGLPWKDIQILNGMATEGTKPHLTVFLDIDPEKGLKRVVDPNRFEAEGVLFQKKVRRGFIKARASDPKRWMTLKVENKTPEELTRQVLKVLDKRFKKSFEGGLL